MAAKKLWQPWMELVSRRFDLDFDHMQGLQDSVLISSFWQLEYFDSGVI